MSSFAPPIRRGDFLYSSVLYADVGNGNHHPRASIAELTSLLRPETRSKDKSHVTPAKDQVGHWYTAQLVHYGLPVTKDKNAAKVRLLTSLNGFKLEVPAWILKVESELRSEWEKENRKLKKGGNGGKGGKGGKGVKEAKGAGAGNGSVGGTQGASHGVNVTVNVSLGSGLSMLEQLGVQKSSNTASSSNASARKRKRDDSKDDKTPKKATPRKKSTAKDGLPLPDWNTMSAAPQKTPSKKPRIKKEPLNQGNFTQSPGTTPKSKIKQEHDSATPWRSSPFKSNQSMNQGYANTVGSDDITISGAYTLTSPSLTSFFSLSSTQPTYLTLLIDSQRNLWWSSFTCASWHFIIQMRPGPIYETLGQPCSLGWRLRDEESGELTFGRGCTGSVTFTRDCTFQGTLYGVPILGDVEIWGEQIAGARGGRGVYEYRREWEEFVQEAYGR